MEMFCFKGKKKRKREWKRLQIYKEEILQEQRSKESYYIANISFVLQACQQYPKNLYLKSFLDSMNDQEHKKIQNDFFFQAFHSQGKLIR